MLSRGCWSVLLALLTQGPTLNHAYEVQTRLSSKIIDHSFIKRSRTGDQSIVFDVKSCGVIFIYLRSSNEESYRITLGSEAIINIIAGCRSGVCSTLKKTRVGLNNCYNYASFWISSSGYTISIGNGCEVYTSSFMAATTFRILDMDHLNISSSDTASWRFRGSSVCNVNDLTTTRVVTTTAPKAVTVTALQTVTTTAPKAVTTIATGATDSVSIPFQNNNHSATGTRETSQSENTTILSRNQMRSSAPISSFAHILVTISLAILSLM